MELGNIIKPIIKNATIISEFVIILVETVIQLLKETQVIIDVLNVKEADISNMEPKTVIQEMKSMMDTTMMKTQMNGLTVIKLVEDAPKQEMKQIHIVLHVAKTFHI
jgi:hypothetical protein